MHFGIVGKIDEIQDEVVRFYSFSGYCISTAGGIEHLLFRCYYSASDLKKDEAAKEFYGFINSNGKRIFRSSSRKLETADKAIRDKISNTATHKIWGELYSEIEAVTGASGARNMLAHNSLSLNSYQNPNEDDQRRPFLFELAVSRSLIEAGVFADNPRTENLKSIRAEACALNSAYMRLWHFYDTYLSHLYKKTESEF